MWYSSVSSILPCLRLHKSTHYVLSWQIRMAERFVRAVLFPSVSRRLPPLFRTSTQGRCVSLFHCAGSLFRLRVPSSLAWDTFTPPAASSPFQGTASSPSKVLIPFSHTEKKLLAVSSLRLFSERPPAFDRVSSNVRSRLVPCAVVPRLAFAIKYRDRGALMPFPVFNASHKSIAAPPPSPVAPSLISVEI